MSKLKRIQVFGERNSGTNYLRKLMRDNYEDIATVGGDLGFGWKHGDLGKPWCYFKDDETKFCHTIQDYKTSSDDVLFAVIYRSPFEWLQSMHQHAHHAPGLFGLDFNEFLRAPWESYYGVPGRESNPDIQVRQDMMKPEERFESYASIFELRKDKIKIFESFAGKVKNVCYVNYEFIRDDPNEAIEQVASHYKIKLRPGFKNITEDKFGNGKYEKKSYPRLTKQQAEYIDNQLNWKLENAIGYEKNLKPIQAPGIINKLIQPRASSEELTDYKKIVRFK